MNRLGFFPLLTALLANAALSVWAVGALAQIDELYIVRDIAVDVSDVSAVEARRKALWEARLLGFHRLLRRATLREDWTRLPRAAFEEIQSMILSLEIESEKSSSTRYLANVTVSFDASAVQSLLAGADVAFLEFSPLASLVLPLYGDDGEWVLWRRPNPLWDAWSGLNDDLLATSYLLPLGDLEDRLALPVRRLTAGEEEPLAKLAARYGVDRILLMRARPDADAPGEAWMSVSVYGVAPAGGAVTKLDSFDFRAPSLEHAAADIAERVEREWKQRSIRKREKPSTFRLRARFGSVEEWARMRRGLESASYIRSLRVEAMDIHGAWLMLGFSGGGQMLADGLRGSGFVVAGGSGESGPDAQGVLTLRLAAAE